MTTTSVAVPNVPLAQRSRGPSPARTIAAALFAVTLTGGAAAGFTLVDVDKRARCEAARDDSGYGKRAALRALDDPDRHDAQRRFLYRVHQEAGTYRAVVVVREGPFTGDAWSRDAEGNVRHSSDLCRDGVDVAGDVIREDA
jgi:hypothetical protein